MIAIHPQVDLAQESADRSTPRESRIELATPTGTLAGTLTTPDGGSDQVALVIAGSGPTDRDGNSAALPGRNDCLKLLAWGLAEAGISSLRFDKRGVGASAKTPELDLRFETFVDDGVAWMRQLEDTQDFRHFSIIGHSEGSLIGALVARRVPIDAFISLEGTGRPAQDTLIDQLRTQLPPTLMTDVVAIIERLAAGKETDPLPQDVAALPPLAAMFRASVQPYLISWFRYDPVAVFAALSVPMLIVQGNHDLQTGIDDADRLVAANPRARRVVIGGMNHVLKEASEDRGENIATYSRPDLALSPALVPAMLEFLAGDTAARVKGRRKWSA